MQKLSLSRACTSIPRARCGTLLSQTTTALGFVTIHHTLAIRIAPAGETGKQHQNPTTERESNITKINK
jgi:hypothetical protein